MNYQIFFISPNQFTLCNSLFSQGVLYSPESVFIWQLAFLQLMPQYPNPFHKILEFSLCNKTDGVLDDGVSSCNVVRHFPSVQVGGKQEQSNDGSDASRDDVPPIRDFEGYAEFHDFIPPKLLP